MGLAIETNGLRAVKNSARLLVKSHDFRLISSFKTDLRSMAKSSNSIKPNLSLHNTKVTLSLA